jgi:acyl-CoA thioesterase-1
MSREKLVMNRAAIPNAPGSILTTALLFVLLVLTLPLAAMAQTPLKIVVLGDSLVAGYGLGPGEAFPEKLALALADQGYNVEVENAGVSGDTSSGGLSRLDWSVGDGADLVIVELGANDALRGLPPEKTRQNLEAIITGLKSRNIEIVLAGMRAPPNMGEDYETRFNAIYPELSEKHGVPLYPFFLDGVAADPDLNQDDGIHPTAAGIDLIIERFLPFFEPVLDARS